MSAAERTLSGGRFLAALDAAIYDRRPDLDERERRALDWLARRTRCAWPKWVYADLARLVAPVEDVLAFVAPRSRWWGHTAARGELMCAMAREGEAFWAFERQRWVSVLEGTHADVRQPVMTVAYLLCGQRDLHRAFPGCKRGLLARRLFGAAMVDESIATLKEHLNSLGRSAWIGRTGMLELMLIAGSPLLEDLACDPQLIVRLHSQARPAIAHGFVELAATMHAIGLLQSSPFVKPVSDSEWLARNAAGAEGVPPEWVAWAQRWYCTSTLTRRTREHHYYTLLKVGRWIAEHDESLADPAAWTRKSAAAWLARLDRMAIGEFSRAPNTAYMRARSGGPLSAATKAGHTAALRAFFRDLQEWEWIDRRFDARLALRVPRSTRALIGPDPRVIADDVWAKLLWAGLNLTEDDLPMHPTGAPVYPLALVRALALLWLFGGLRLSEIRRLRLGAVRWQQPAGEQQEPVCLLEVPTSKTATTFTKPVDGTVGRAIEDWQAARPQQPPLIDQKTGERVQMLFAYRGAQIGSKYVNRVLIPLLCRKAGVPDADVRGSITSHRARATIASQLYNAKNPMSLFELQEWLGHRSPHSTAYYARLTPTTLARAYSDAGYFQRNLRTIEVLLDREAIQTGQAAVGGAYQYYDLGHGYCSYSFFEQCPHRMACARCDFYLPKQSARAQLLEANNSLQRMLVEIPLTEEETAAVKDDHDAVSRLLDRLIDTPTPAGPTPRALTSSDGEPARGETTTEGKDRENER